MILTNLKHCSKIIKICKCLIMVVFIIRRHEVILNNRRIPMLDPDS